MLRIRSGAQKMQNINLEELQINQIYLLLQSTNTTC